MDDAIKTAWENLIDEYITLLRQGKATFSETVKKVKRIKELKANIEGE